MIAAGVISEELYKIEYQIRLNQDRIEHIRELTKIYQGELDKLWADFAVLEEKKYRLFTGRAV